MQAIKKNRLGESKLNNDGIRMVIIIYNHCDDISVKFEDGTIVNNRHYNDFKLGNIRHPKTIGSNTYNNRCGETNFAKNGMLMTIINYRNSNDIDIQFEDGMIVKHVRYEKFKHGYIRNPNLYQNKPEDRIGQTIMANCGMKMTIIDYRNASDLDVKFEDGTIVLNKAYNAFAKGQINNPNIMKSKRIGETNIATNGMKMTIIDYTTADDMAVQFEDGAIVEHTSYGCFKKHDIANPNCNLNDIHYHKVGEVGKANCGMKMKIIEYRSCKDIDVEFEDGFVRKHTRYHKFTHGHIQHDFPYNMNNRITLHRISYVHQDEVNLEYSCCKCLKHDIDTLENIKTHKCII